MNKTKIDIVYLADHKEFVSACAAWAYGQWGTQRKDGSLDRAIQRFMEGAQKEAIPLTLIALSNGLPVGMVSLWASDSDNAPELTPWLASLYVHPFHRGKGVASKLVMRLESEAKKLDYETLYLNTEDAQDLYAGLEWKEFRCVTSNFGLASLMRKDFFDRI